MRCIAGRPCDSLNRGYSWSCSRRTKKPGRAKGHDPVFVFKLQAKPTLGRGVFREVRSLLGAFSRCSGFATSAALLRAATLSLGLADLATGAASLALRLATAIGCRFGATARCGGSFTTARGGSFTTARGGFFTRRGAALGWLAALVPAGLANLLALGGLALVTIEQPGRSLAVAHDGKATDYHDQGDRPCHYAFHVSLLL